VNRTTRPGEPPTAAPPPRRHGLTLEEVTYPADDELAAQAERDRPSTPASRNGTTSL